MRNSKAFETGLDALFCRSTEKVRREAGKRAKGPVPKIDRRRLAKEIERLVEVARASELHSNGRDIFEGVVREKRQWHPKRGKGWGVGAKKRTFRRWYDDNIRGRTCIYAFWAKRKCLYVGRTGVGGRRPQAHFEKFWFRSVTRIDTYVVSGKRNLPMAECLAIHLFRPTTLPGIGILPAYRCPRPCPESRWSPLPFHMLARP